VARILIVDDNVDAAKTLDLLLRGSGHETRVCNDGAACLEEAKRFQPDVVLVDLGLPGLNGYDVARSIRALPSGKTVLIIAITAYGDAADRVARAREAGIDHYMVKPADLDRLMGLIARHPVRHD
jgi:DNA-binding response OmpR family regulator